MAKITIHIRTTTPDRASEMLNEIRQSIISRCQVDGHDKGKDEGWSMIVEGEYAE